MNAGQHGRTYNESIPGLEHHRRTSNSSGGSEEMVNPTASTSKNVNQSKFAVRIEVLNAVRNKNSILNFHIFLSEFFE